MSEPRRRGERSVLLALLLAAFALRALTLAAQSLWYDEGVSAWLARQPLAAIAAWTARDVQPPLYYGLLSGWTALAGESEYSLRFLSVACGLVAVALMYRLARWQSPHGAAPLWAAALATFHPLLLYYAQEARMYSLLAALTLAAGVLLQPALRGSMAWRRWIAFALLCVLAVYTHYFALFVLVGFALAWLIGWRSHGKDLLRFAVAIGLVLAGIAPWLWTTARTLAVDRSYWTGEFDLLDALHDVAIRFVGGETVPERQAIWVAMVVVAVTSIGFVWMWRGRRAQRLSLGFAGLWLATPVTAAMLLAYGAPKFNPRYVLIALPGLILILALLLEALGEKRSDGRRWLTIGVAILLFAPSLWSAGNWFFTHEYDKAQWRQLAEYLRPRRTPDEALILVSGHAWPVWDYYAPDMPALHLPDLEVLDVNSTLTFENSAGPLREALAELPGAWLIGWQEEIVDPNDVVPAQLELAGREKGSSARFHLISLRRFSRLHAHRTADAPPISVPVGADFGNLVRLEGYRPLDNGDLLLFWRRDASTPADADYHVAIEVLDSQGVPLRTVADRRLGGYNYPSFRWRPGEVVMGRIAATDWLGEELPVADYDIRLRVYDANDPNLAPLPLSGGIDELTLTAVRPVLE